MTVILFELLSCRSLSDVLTPLNSDPISDHKLRLTIRLQWLQHLLQTQLQIPEVSDMWSCDMSPRWCQEPTLTSQTHVSFPSNVTNRTINYFLIYLHLIHWVGELESTSQQQSVDLDTRLKPSYNNNKITNTSHWSEWKDYLYFCSYTFM